jgi:hypothetical protein
MGYRGSKLVVRKGSTTTVKEQRVDGSWHNNGVMCLRCILMDFERNYQIKVLSNQINKQSRFGQVAWLNQPYQKKGRFFSWVPSKAVQQDSTQDLTMDPWFVTGFTDGEGCFALSVRKRKRSKNSSIEKSLIFKKLYFFDFSEARFAIGLHKRSSI